MDLAAGWPVPSLRCQRFFTSAYRGGLGQGSAERAYPFRRRFAGGKGSFQLWVARAQLIERRAGTISIPRLLKLPHRPLPLLLGLAEMPEPDDFVPRPLVGRAGKLLRSPVITAIAGRGGLREQLLSVAHA